MPSHSPHLDQGGPCGRPRQLRNLIRYWQWRIRGCAPVAAVLPREVAASKFARIALGCLLVMGLACFVLFDRLGVTREPIWDEAYYLPTTARFHQGRVQFASHPPLGLMLIAAGDRLYDHNARIDLRRVAAAKSVRAEVMPRDYDYSGPRLASAFFGVLGAGMFFLLMAMLTRSPGMALILSALFVCDTAFIAQFRAAHLDAFQLFFVLGAIISAIRAIRSGKARWGAIFGTCLACACLVRVNAIALCPMVLFFTVPPLCTRQFSRSARQAAATLGGALLALCTIALLYAALSPNLPDPSTEAGRKDLPFLSPSVLAQGRIDAGNPRVAAVLALDYARFITSDYEHMARSDANGSHPWQWVLGAGAITYRWDASPRQVSTIALSPNYPIWWLSLAGVICAIWSMRRAFDIERGMLLAAWFSNMALLVWLDRTRVLYLYAYFIPLLIGHALLATHAREGYLRENTVRAGIACVTIGFLICAPLAYHHPVPVLYCRVVLRECGTH